MLKPEYAGWIFLQGARYSRPYDIRVYPVSDQQPITLHIRTREEPRSALELLQLIHRLSYPNAKPVTDPDLLQKISIGGEGQSVTAFAGHIIDEFCTLPSLKTYEDSQGTEFHLAEEINAACDKAGKMNDDNLRELREQQQTHAEKANAAFKQDWIARFLRWKVDTSEDAQARRLFLRQYFGLDIDHATADSLGKFIDAIIGTTGAAGKHEGRYFTISEKERRDVYETKKGEKIVEVRDPDGLLLVWKEWVREPQTRVFVMDILKQATVKYNEAHTDQHVKVPETIADLDKTGFEIPEGVVREITQNLKFVEEMARIFGNADAATLVSIFLSSVVNGKNGHILSEEEKEALPETLQEKYRDKQVTVSEIFYEIGNAYIHAGKFGPDNDRTALVNRLYQGVLGDDGYHRRYVGGRLWTSEAL